MVVGAGRGGVHADQVKLGLPAGSGLGSRPSIVTVPRDPLLADDDRCPETAPEFRNGLLVEDFAGKEQLTVVRVGDRRSVALHIDLKRVRALMIVSLVEQGAVQTVTGQLVAGKGISAVV